MPIPSGYDVAKVKGNHQHCLPAIAYIIERRNSVMVTQYQLKYIVDTTNWLAVKVEGNIYDE